MSEFKYPIVLPPSQTRVADFSRGNASLQTRNNSSRQTNLPVPTSCRYISIRRNGTCKQTASMNEYESSVISDSGTLTSELGLSGTAASDKDQALPSPQTAMQDLLQSTSNSFGLAILQYLSSLPQSLLHDYSPSLCARS